MSESESVALAKLSKLIADIPSQILEKVPIDLQTVGSYLGVERVIERELDVAGLLYRLDANKSVIFIRKGDSPGRRRFSWAHELGHIIMANGDMSRIACRAPNQTDRELERSCDVIAAELLMPRESFSSEVDSLGLTLRSVPVLADRFKVTIEACAWRMQECANEPLMMSKWRASDNQPLLRLEHLVSIPNLQGRTLKPNVRWDKSSDALLPLYEGFKSRGVSSGHTKVLMGSNGESRYSWVVAEGLGTGSGKTRRVLGLHYLARKR